MVSIVLGTSMCPIVLRLPVRGVGVRGPRMLVAVSAVIVVLAVTVAVAVALAVAVTVAMALAIAMVATAIFHGQICLHSR